MLREWEYEGLTQNAPADATELRNIRVAEVSLVDAPANQRRWLLLKRGITADAETALIRESAKTPAAQGPHPFKAAEWTHKNGHPRCRLCGSEETLDGQCPGLIAEPVKFGPGAVQKWIALGGGVGKGITMSEKLLKMVEVELGKSLNAAERAKLLEAIQLLGDVPDAAVVSVVRQLMRVAGVAPKATPKAGTLMPIANPIVHKADDIPKPVVVQALLANGMKGDEVLEKMDVETQHRYRREVAEGYPAPPRKVQKAKRPQHAFFDLVDAQVQKAAGKSSYAECAFAAATADPECYSDFRRSIADGTLGAAKA